MALRFGTDGVRGDTRAELTADAVEALGRAAAEILGAERFAVGRDTRVSGPDLTEALLRGVRRAGGSAVDLGVVPTPAVARWCDQEQVAGAMVSASHNPWHDNGVKLFAPGGRKLSDKAQHSIEQRLAAGDCATDTAPQPNAADLDHAANAADMAAASDGDIAACEQHKARQRHIAAVTASIEGRNLDGLRVVADVANGAAHVSAPECLLGLGAQVETIHANPDGHNINEGCGSLHPERLQEAVVASGADAGLAFDGDADRVLAVDHRGNLIDGDQILAVCALDRSRRGRLAGDRVVATVMANGGLHRAMAAHGIGVVTTPVGDRHVLSALEDEGLVLGGEQSGHLIFRDMATTGDGLLTAVQLLDTVKRSGVSLRDLAAASMTRMPQVLVGVPVPAAARRADIHRAVGPIAADAESRLGDSGRVLVRPSGTESVIRVMVEAADADTARSEADRVAARVHEAISCP